MIKIRLIMDSLENIKLIILYENYFNLHFMYIFNYLTIIICSNINLHIFLFLSVSATNNAGKQGGIFTMYNYSFLVCILVKSSSSIW